MLAAAAAHIYINCPWRQNNDAMADCSRCSAPACSLQPQQRDLKAQQRAKLRAHQRTSPAAVRSRPSPLGLPSTSTSSTSQQLDATQPTLGQPPSAAQAAMLLAAGGFAATAADVLAPGSLHLLQPLDEWAHAAVAGAHWQPELQRLLAGAALLGGERAMLFGIVRWKLPTLP